MTKQPRVKLAPTSPLTPHKFKVAHTSVEITAEHIIIGNTMIYRVGMTPEEIEAAFQRHLIEQRWAGAQELRNGIKQLLDLGS